MRSRGLGAWLGGLCLLLGSACDPSDDGAGQAMPVAPAPVLLGVPVGASPNPPGTRPDPSQPEGTDLMPGIKHIVVLMMENHSFDNYFGMLGRGDGLTLGPDGQPVNQNPAQDGTPVRAYHLPTTDQTSNKVAQSWVASHRQLNGGKVDGFVVTSGTPGMGYWTGAEIPFYYSLAQQFPVCDRYFGSVLAPTFPNRRFMLAGTAHGMVVTELPDVSEPPPVAGTIFDKLDALGISWREYTADRPQVLLFPTQIVSRLDHITDIQQFLADAASGDLPAYSLITPHDHVSEENPQDIHQGEAFSAGIINALLKSPAWGSTILVFTYDEHGGYYDHVVPPAAFAPDDIPPNPNKTRGVPGGYDQLGFRVPAVIVSPYAKPNYVSHVVHDHTSILRLVETKWNLGALTYRDANASNLLDALDFAAPPAFATPPPLASSALPPNPLPTPPMLAARPH